MSGDIQNHYENFKKQLKKIEFKDQFTFDYVQDNNPTFFLRLLHYVLVEYNPNFYKILVDKGYELFSKNDLRFAEQVFKLLTIEFNYKSQINIAHFLSEQYLEHKLILINDIISEVLQKGRKEKRQVSLKGQENTSYIHNAQKQESNKKQKAQVFVQKEQYLNDEDDDIIDEQPKRPEPYQKQEIDLDNQVYKNTQVERIQEYSLIKKNDYLQQQTESSNEKDSKPKDISINLKQQQVEQQYCQYQLQQQQQQTFQSQNTSQVVQQQNGVSHQDLQKLMQVILISNENIKSVMQKFSELQTTVNIALSNFDQRLARLELKIRDQ